MKQRRHTDDATRAFEELLLASPGEERYVLQLFVAGMTPRSLAAFTTIEAICKEHLQGSCELEVIDIYQNPALVKEEEIIAVPTLVKKMPLPIRRLIGNLSDEERVLVGLNLHRKF